MRTLGRALKMVGNDKEAGGRRGGLLYTNLPLRSSLLARIERMAGRLPRRAGAWAAGGFLAVWLAYGAALGGHVSTVGSAAADGVGHVAAQAGLGIERVHISGHRETRESDILRALDLAPSSSLVTLDPYAARARLEEIGWVRAATVKKLFPSTLEVEIVEREAFALWQIGGIVSVIDRSGATLDLLTERRHARLPMVVGYGANRQAAELIDALDAHPRLAGRVRAAVRVAERRWNLRLDNGVEVRLPEHDPAGALAELVRLDEERGLLSRDIVAVDMRLDDRIVVRLSDTGAMRRKMEAVDGRSARRGSDA